MNSFEVVQLTATAFEFGPFSSSIDQLAAFSHTERQRQRQIQRDKTKDKELLDDLAKDSVPVLRHEYKETKINI